MGPSSVRVKICGITRPEDAAAAARAGADAIGLNFVAGPRKIQPQHAPAILEAVPDRLNVWLLADVSNGDLPDPLKGITTGGRVSHVQMYGSVAPDALVRLNGRGLRTVAVRQVADQRFADQADAWLRQCRPVVPDLILLDAAGPLPGGTGRTLNWDMIAACQRAGRFDGWPPIVLAGGLTPGNVARAIRTVAPTWVDVSSGVESSPGCKDAAKIEAFVKTAKPTGL